MRANAGGTTARLARRGHLSHGVNQIAMPKASAIPYTAAIAVGFDPGAGSGRVTSPSTPAPAKNTAAKRPNSLRRSGGPWFSDEAPGWSAGTGGLSIGPISPTSRSGRTTVVSARCSWPGRTAASPLPRCAANGSLTIEARSHLSWEQISTPGFTSVNRRHLDAREGRQERPVRARRPQAGSRPPRYARRGVWAADDRQTYQFPAGGLHADSNQSPSTKLEAGAPPAPLCGSRKDPGLTHLPRCAHRYQHHERTLTKGFPAAPPARHSQPWQCRCRSQNRASCHKGILMTGASHAAVAAPCAAFACPGQD